MFFKIISVILAKVFLVSFAGALLDLGMLDMILVMLATDVITALVYPVIFGIPGEPPTS